MSLPLPPPALRNRVAGTEDAAWFEECGEMTLASFERALGGIGRSLDDFQSIFDFGAGCGRLTRRLLQRARQARVAASDIDAPAIAWMREYLPEVDARVNEGLPPLTFADASFDLVTAFSVFTHLDEKYQDSWLTELHRVTMQGAILLLTVHGEWNWNDHVEKLPDLPQYRAELDQRGFLFYTGEGWDKLDFPDFYHTSFHRPEYIQRHWPRWFDVLAVLPSGAQPPQDLVVCRHR